MMQTALKADTSIKGGQEQSLFGCIGYIAGRVAFLPETWLICWRSIQHTTCTHHEHQASIVTKITPPTKANSENQSLVNCTG
jgi:hypothetical protein